MTKLHDRAAAIADGIEAELGRLGRWSAGPIDPARLVDMGPFGMKTLAAEEWIQFVLVPRIREIVAKGGDLPTSSETAVWATRQFDGDLDAAHLVELLGELDALVEDLPGALIAAVASGDAGAVERVLERGADPLAVAPDGLRALHVAAAGGHPALATLLATPFAVDLAAIARDQARDGEFAAIARMLLAEDVDPDPQDAPSLLTPLMVATYFGRGDVAEVLRAGGADAARRDAWGRTPDRFAVFQTLARLIAVCHRLPMVRAAYLAQLHNPVHHQFTTPVVGLELSAPLPADAFAGWPADHPIVAFVLADDAVSRLIRLFPPIYTAAPTTAVALAGAIARALGGHLREVPTEEPGEAFAVGLPDGQVAVLIRDHGHVFGISGPVGRSWQVRAGSEAAAAVAEVVAAARASDPGRVGIVELALDLAAVLSKAQGERWTLNIPGTPDPSEMWLHGSDHAAASVGVFAGVARIWVEDAMHEVPAPDRAALPAACDRVVGYVHQQIGLYRRNVGLRRRMQDLAVELADRLGARLAGAWSWTLHGSASHAAVGTAVVTCIPADGRPREAVVISAAGDGLRAHAGVVGADGWDGELEDLDAALPAIAGAVDRGLHTLTLDRLAPGKRYRVREGLQELRAGEVVRFDCFDDVDNHHGLYRFTTSDGRAVAVAGDYSTPRNSPLGEVHRYLEELPD